MSLSALLDLSLVGRADQPALDDATVTPDAPVTYTFGEIDARANATARLLAARGFVAGDRLAFFLPNRIELLDLFLACVRLGVIAVPMNSLYREREVAHLVEDSAPKVVVTTADRAAYLPAGTPWWDVATLAEEAAAHVGPRLVASIEPQAVAALVYTSGTTGRAKGAMLTRDNLAANATALTTCWQITAADRYLAVLPLFHVHGLGERRALLARERLPHAPGGALRRDARGRRAARLPPDAALRRARGVRAPAGARRRPRA